MGAKATLNVQLAPAASDAPQLLVCVNSPAAAIDNNETADPPLLVTVVALVGEVVLTATEPKSSTPLVNEMVGAVMRNALRWFGVDVTNPLATIRPAAFTPRASV